MKEEKRLHILNVHSFCFCDTHTHKSTKLFSFCCPNNWNIMNKLFQIVVENGKHFVQPNRMRQGKNLGFVLFCSNLSTERKIFVPQLPSAHLMRFACYYPIYLHLICELWLVFMTTHTHIHTLAQHFVHTWYVYALWKSAQSVWILGCV